MHIFLPIVCFAAALPAAGFLYQWIGAHCDRRRYAGAGRCVDIGDGGKLYLFEQGSGGPTVVFESGIAATNLNWCHIQEMVSRFTHTASYDRCGLGWSSPCRTARTPGNIAIELHALLQCAGIKPPYLLVGHSFGGLVMRRYAIMYPEDVAGVVLVDPMRPEEWQPLDAAAQSTLERGKKLSRWAIPIARFGLARLAVTSLLCRSGRLSSWLARAGGGNGLYLLTRITDEVGKMPPKVWPVVAAHWSRPGYYAGMKCHIAAVPDTVREMKEADPIRDIPVLLLTAGTSLPLCEQQLDRIGDTVQQVIAPASAHWIHLDEPDLVVDSIRNMVTAEVRTHGLHTVKPFGFSLVLRKDPFTGGKATWTRGFNWALNSNAQMEVPDE
jgi:pimeloyl-ACP methyl ester carboxylesterase